MAYYEFPEADTDPIPFQFEDEAVDGTKTNPDITGGTVALKVWDRDTTSVTLTGSVVIDDASTGKVSYNRDGQLTEAGGPYWVRWELTMGGQVKSYPNTRGPDVWEFVVP